MHPGVKRRERRVKKVLTCRPRAARPCRTRNVICQPCACVTTCRIIREVHPPASATPKQAGIERNEAVAAQRKKDRQTINKRVPQAPSSTSVELNPTPSKAAVPSSVVTAQIIASLRGVVLPTVAPAGQAPRVSALLYERWQFRERLYFNRGTTNEKTGSQIDGSHWIDWDSSRLYM